eukprot:g13687.t1
MGIKNLWQLLSPVGRSVSIETLAGKTLAVDVSIWLTQFIKAMRDDDGKVMKNSHIIGTLRRVVKLLFHRIRPVFVFDGGAPALKGRTLAARRKLRSEGTDSSVRKTAQRILASQLKKHKTAMSAAKRGSSQAATVAFNPVYQNPNGNIPPTAAAAAAQTSTSEEKTGDAGAGADAGVTEVDGDDDDDDDEDEDDDDDDDDDVDWEEQEIDRGDGGRALGARGQVVGDSDGDEVWQAADTTAARGASEGAAARASSGGRGAAGAAAGGDDEPAEWAVDTDDEDKDGSVGWEEVELPERNEDIDPEVIASLPDHVKKQVIEAAKRRQRMRSRAQYMPVAGNPAMYSQTQLSNFLRAKQLNSQILKAQKQEDGEREGKRIASEAGRRYIMTAAGTIGGAGGSRGSRSTRMESSTSGSLNKRRRRITDDGDDFKEWSCAPGTAVDTGARRTGGVADASAAISKPGPWGAMGTTGSSGAAGTAKGPGGRRLHQEEEEDDEEAGGFLPESEGEEDAPALVPATAAAAAAGKGKSKSSSGKGKSRESHPGDYDTDDAGGGDDDGGGGGFLEISEGGGGGGGGGEEEEEESEEVVSRSSNQEKAATRTRKGNGRVRGKSVVSAARPKPIGHDLPRPKGGKGKRRLQKLGDTADFDDEEEEEEEEEEHADDSGVYQPSARQDSESAEAVARMLQEEEDRRAAVAVQNGMDASAAAAVALAGDNGGHHHGDDPPADADDVDHSLDPLGLLSSASRRKLNPVPPGGVTVAPGDDNGADKRAMNGTVPSKVFTSDGGGTGNVSADRGGPVKDAEIELEIDLKDLERGGGGGIGGPPVFVSLFSSGAGGGAGLRARAGSGVAKEEDSDEDFDGFVDDDGGEEEKEEEELERGRFLSTTSSQGATMNVTNEEALQRSVDMASRMAGWAGRVVERVLKEHRQPAASSASAAGSSSFHTARANSSSGAPAAHSIPAFDPVRTGPAASGVGSHAAAQAASEERRRLEESANGSGGGGSIGNGGGSTTRPVPGGGTSLSPPSSKTGQARHERRRLGSGAAGADGAGGADGGGYGGLSSSDEDNLAGSAFRPPGRDGPVMDEKSSVSGDGVLTVSCASAGSKEFEGQGGGGTAISEVGPKAQAESPVTKGVVSTIDGDKCSTDQGARSAATAASGESSAAAAVAGDESRRAVDEEGQHSGDNKPTERGGSGVSSLPPPPPTASPYTTQGSATAGEGESAGVASAEPMAAATPAAPRFGREDGEDEEMAVRFASTGEGEDPTANGKPASAAPAFGENASDVPPLGGDDFTGTGGGTGVLFPSMPVAQGMVEEQGGFVGGGGEGGGIEGVSSSAYLGGMDEDELARESDRLRRESNRAQRDAETVTEEMKEEVMDLLKLFGVPYVVAPMEAEAQCCMLERLKLVDGTVTDDSDAFAFGGRAVYKNIFNERKYVEAYLLPDAEKDLGVGTEEVIALALLLGSDYTEGVRGVGIVNAMEVINAFPLEGKGAHYGLSKFKKWIDGFDPLLDQELEELTKRGSKTEIDGLSLEMKFHLKHKTARNRWTVPEGFPSKEVINAYNNPQVDKSEEPFSWAAPDVDGLRALCQRVLGWDRVQSDGLLMPMVKELDKAGFSQPRIDSYFMTYHDNKRVAAIKSKRLRTAVEDLANGPTEVLTVDNDSSAGKATKTPRAKKKKTAAAAAAAAEAAAAAASTEPPSTTATTTAPPNSRQGDPSASESEEAGAEGDDAPIAKKRRRKVGGRPSPPPAEDGEAIFDTPASSSSPPSARARPRSKRGRSSAASATEKGSVSAASGSGRSRRSTRTKTTAAAPADTGASASASSGGNGRGTAGKRPARRGKGRGGGVADTATAAAAAAAAMSPAGKRRNPRRSAASGGGVGNNVGDELLLGDEAGGSDNEGEEGVDEDDDPDFSGGSSWEDSSDEGGGVVRRRGGRRTSGEKVNMMAPL